MVDLAPIGPEEAPDEDWEPTAAARLLLDSFDRIAASVEKVVEGLDVAQLAFRPKTEANSIAWLVWHLTRIQDDHLAGAFDHQQVWMADGWSERFQLPFHEEATGYGHRVEDVSAVRVEGSLLRDYHRAVHRRTQRDIKGLRDADLDRVVDESWDPPVTMAVRLVSVVTDDLEHAGQAAYLRGLLPGGD